MAPKEKKMNWLCGKGRELEVPENVNVYAHAISCHELLRTLAIFWREIQISKQIYLPSILLYAQKL